VDKKFRDVAKRELKHLWNELEDNDNSNTMSLAELKHLFNTSERFRDYFKSLDIDMPFLEYAFKIMDADGSGDCSLEDFAASVVQLKNTDPGPVASFIKYQLSQLSTDVADLKTFVLQSEMGRSAKHLAEQDRVNPAPGRVLELESKMSPRPLSPSPNPLIVVDRSGTDAIVSTEGIMLEREEGETPQTKGNDTSMPGSALGADVLSVFKATLQQEQRLLAAESQRRQDAPPATAGTSSSSPVPRLPPLQPYAAAAMSREQSEELVDMLRREYERPASPKARGFRTEPVVVRTYDI